MRRYLNSSTGRGQNVEEHNPNAGSVVDCIGEVMDGIFPALGVDRDALSNSLG